MTTKLHPKAREAVKAALIRDLPFAQIEKGRSLDGISAFVAAYMADEALPQTGKLNDELVDIVDERPFANFVGDLLRSRLRDECDYDPEAEKERLVETGIFGDANELAEWLIGEFETLPWQYSIAAELPSSAIPIELIETTARSVGQECQIVRADLFLADRLPLTHPNPSRNVTLREGGFLGLLAKEPEWKSDRAYFVQERSGSVGIYGGGTLLEPDPKLS